MKNLWLKGRFVFLIFLLILSFSVTEGYTERLFLPLILRQLPVVFEQGFENGKLDSDGWAKIQTNIRETWKIADNYPYTGTFLASVDCDEQLQPQMEVLLSPPFPARNASLEFYSFGSLTWCRDEFDNCDLMVWLVVGDWDGGSGDDIFIKKADDDWIKDPNFQGWSIWTLTGINLSPFLQSLPNGTSVRIGFQYIGQDGAEIGLDNIVLR
jgi:hypothetical protein